MGFFDSLRRLLIRRQAKSAKEQREVELGERVNPALLKQYKKGDVWAQLNPYEQEQLLRAKRVKGGR